MKLDLIYMCAFWLLLGLITGFFVRDIHAPVPVITYNHLAELAKDYQED